MCPSQPNQFLITGPFCLFYAFIVPHEYISYFGFKIIYLIITYLGSFIQIFAISMLVNLLLMLTAIVLYFFWGFISPPQLLTLFWQPQLLPVLWLVSCFDQREFLQISLSLLCFSLRLPFGESDLFFVSVC